MFRTLAAVVVALSAVWMADPTITMDPIPPTQGSKATVCYTGTCPVSLELVWEPPGSGPAQLEVDASGCALLTLPIGAMSVKIIDPNGLADALATMISPP